MAAPSARAAAAAPAAAPVVGELPICTMLQLTTAAAARHGLCLSQQKLLVSHVNAYASELVRVVTSEANRHCDEQAKANTTLRVLRAPHVLKALDSLDIAQYGPAARAAAEAESVKAEAKPLALSGCKVEAEDEDPAASGTTARGAKKRQAGRSKKRAAPTAQKAEKAGKAVQAKAAATRPKKKKRKKQPKMTAEELEELAAEQDRMLSASAAKLQGQQ